MTHSVGDAAALRDALRRLLTSSTFAGSSRLRDFLAFIVEEHLAGRGDAIKEYIIGIEVYKKPPGYDPRVDAAVRVDAGKLRARLERYYETEGRDDAIRITIPKGGYIPSFEVQTQTAPAQDLVPQSGTGRRRQLLLTIGLTAACVLVLLWAVVALHPRPVSELRIRTWPLTGYDGEQYDPSLSPDGSVVAFSWNGEKQDDFDIYLKALMGPQPVRLTSDPARDYAPSWSPDGQQIAFLRKTAARSTAMVIPALGGAERPIAPAEGYSVAWTKDSRSLVLTRRPAPGRPYAGFLTSLESGEQRQITFPGDDCDVGDYDFAVSPDGHEVAFARGCHLPPAELWTLDLRSGKASHRRTEIYLWGLAWAPGGRELIFSTRTAGATGLWRLDIPSGRISPMGMTALDATRPSVARQSRGADRLAYQRTVRRVNLFVRAVSPGPAPREIAATVRESLAPRFSPDGQRIAFASSRSGFWSIWTCRRDGSDLRNLTPTDWLSVGAPRWSPDGSRIAFDARRENETGNRDIFVVNADATGPPRQLTRGQGDCVRPSWSSDGGSIYFSLAEGKVRQIWKMPLSAGHAARITANGGFDSQESADGGTLFYTQAYGKDGLWRMAVAGGPEQLVAQDGRESYWGLTRKGLMFMDRLSRLCTLALNSVSPVCGAPIDKTSDWRGMGFSPGGDEIVYSLAQPVQSELILLEGALFR